MRSFTLPLLTAALCCCACAEKIVALPQLDQRVPGEGAGMNALALSVEGHGSLLVNPAHQLCAGTGCVYELQRGSQVELQAAADPSHYFVRWEGACQGTEKICRLSLEQSEVVAAIFDRLPGEDHKRAQQGAVAWSD